MRFIDRDVIVIGAGVDGLLNAYLAALAGYRVTTFVRSASARGSTYNNQAWFQSGLLYAVRDIDLGRLIRFHGPRLLREFGFRPDPQGGVFRVGTDTDRDRLTQAAEALAIDTMELLHPRDSRHLLGPYHRDDLSAYLVPDGPFPEADLMAVIRDAAEDAGAEFRAFPEGVALKPMPGATNEFYIETPEGNFKAGATLLCAGAFTNALLAPLGASVPGLVLFRSPLMRIPDEPRLRSALLVDLSDGGLSVLRHNLHRSRAQMGLVIGNRMRTAVDGDQPAPDPTPTQAETNSLLQLLPHAPPENKRLANCCYKAEMLADTGDPTVRSWAEEIEGYCGLFAGGAGKATLGLHAAELMLQKAGLTGRQGAGIPAEPLGGTIWRDSHRMWFETDLESEEEANDEGEEEEGGVE